MVILGRHGETTLEIGKVLKRFCDKLASMGTL